MSLDGYYRGTDTKVNTNDLIGRKNAIKTLKEVFGWELKSNPTKYKIDLLFEDRKGGVDVEEGKWAGRYKDQNPENFNQFTMNWPTAQFQLRKQKYLQPYTEWVSSYGNLKTEHTPHYKNNAIIRFNVDFTEFFIVDYEAYQRRLEQIGLWSPYTVFKLDRFGNRVLEEWMCWELNTIPFYVKENGIWIEDTTTWSDPKSYNDYLEKYREYKRIYYELQQSVHQS